MSYDERSFYAGKQEGLAERVRDVETIQKLRAEDIDRYEKLISEHAQAHVDNIMAMDKMRREGALLILDEVMTGFRLAFGGASELYGIKADLVTLGKIIGGGLPVGAYGGAAKIMDMIAPVGPVYQAGTLSGNPLAMAAGIATLGYLQEHAGEVYPRIEATAKALFEGVATEAAAALVHIALADPATTAVVACALAGNAGSLLVLEKLGLERVGEVMLPEVNEPVLKLARVKERRDWQTD